MRATVRTKLDFRLLYGFPSQSLLDLSQTLREAKFEKRTHLRQIDVVEEVVVD